MKQILNHSEMHRTIAGRDRVWNGAIFKKPEKHSKGGVKMKTIQRALLTVVVVMMMYTPAFAGGSDTLLKAVFNGDTEADKQAQNATYAGVAVGTAASVGALIGTGAGPACLATIGAMVGGGMAAGAVAVLAAPAVAAVAAGAAVYWLLK